MDKTLQFDNNRIKRLTAQVLSGHFVGKRRERGLVLN